MPELRSILNKHDIDYSSNAKKLDLVEIFEEKITPNSGKWLRDYRSKVANSNNADIVYVGTGESKYEVTPKQKTPKKTSKISTSKQGTPRLDTPEPQVKSSSESPFTDDNVFQSKSADGSKKRGHDDDSEVKNKKKKKKKKHMSVEEAANSLYSSPRSKLLSPYVKAFDSTQTPTPAGIANALAKLEAAAKAKHEEKPVVESKNKVGSAGSSKVEPAEFKSKVEPAVSTKSKVESVESKSDVDPVSKVDPVSASKTKSKVKSEPTPSKVAKTTKVESTEPTPSKIKTVKSKLNTPSKAATPKAKSVTTSTKGTPLKSQHSTPLKRSQTPVYEKIEDEEEDFNQELSKIKNQTPTRSKKVNAALTPNRVTFSEQATPLRLNTSNRVLRSSNPSTPKKIVLSPLKLTPKPRLIPIRNELTDLSDELDSDTTSGEDVKDVEVTDIKETEEEAKTDANATAKTSESDTSAKAEEIADGRNDQSRHSARQILISKPGISYLLTAFLAWIVLVTSGLFGYWYREQLDLVGYCGQEIDTPTFYPSENKYLVQAGEYLDAHFKPSCIPCPSHARCFPHLELGCFEDFIEFKPWYSFIIPHNTRCIPDTKKAEKIEIIIEVALDLLRSKNANRNCGHGTDEEAGVSMSELHDLLLSMKAPYISIEEFEELWQRSIVELEKEPDVIVRQVD